MLCPSESVSYTHLDVYKRQLVGYLVYTIRYPSKKAEEAMNYKAIGTLTIGETAGQDAGGQTGE